MPPGVVTAQGTSLRMFPLVGPLATSLGDVTGQCCTGVSRVPAIALTNVSPPPLDSTAPADTSCQCCWHTAEGARAGPHTHAPWALQQEWDGSFCSCAPPSSSPEEPAHHTGAHEHPLPSQGAGNALIGEAGRSSVTEPDGTTENTSVVHHDF